tara:strand:+ start:325 stop:1131 length:807 start_codon:yes stop_codon:yes gene_type:complete
MYRFFINNILFVLFFLCNFPFFFANASSPINIQSHIAVYEMTLKESRVKNIIDIRGRMVLELKNTCKGFFQKQRMAMKIYNANGFNFFSDSSYNTWESHTGKKLSFSSKNYLNGKLADNHSGNAIKNNKNVNILFEEPFMKEINLSKDTVFPMKYFTDLIKASMSKNTIFEKKIYDGSGPDGIYNAIAIISQNIESKKLGNIIDSLKGLESWWINMAYFSSSSEEIKPDYEAAFTLYDNGVINNLSLDYQRFEVKTQLVNLKYINTNC